MRYVSLFAAIAMGAFLGIALAEYQLKSQLLTDDKSVQVKTYVYPDVKDTVLPLGYVADGFSATDSIRGDFAGIHQQIKAINAGIEKLKQDRDYWMNKALDPRCDVWRAEQ